MQPCIHVHTHAYMHAYIHAYMLGVHDTPACMYTHTYTFIHTDMYSCTCKLACIHMYAHRYAYAQLCRHTYKHACTTVHAYIYIHTYMRTYVYIYYVHAYIHARILIYLHVCQIMRTDTHLHECICLYFPYVHTYLSMHVGGAYNCDVGRWLAPTSWVPTCRCMNIHIHTHTYLYMHKSCICTCLRIHTCLHAYICYIMFLYMHAYMGPYLRIRIYAYLHACIYILAYVPTTHSCIRTYAGHSYRRGGATFGCKIAPGDHTLVKWVGDWLSDTYLMYNELDVESMLKLPRMMAAAVVNQFRRWRDMFTLALHTPVWASEGLLGRGLACCTFGGSLARLRTT
jgi:hypothetical protein